MAHCARGCNEGATCGARLLRRVWRPAGIPSSGQLSCGSDPQKPPRLPAMSGTSSMTMSSNVSCASGSNTGHAHSLQTFL